MQRKAFSFWGGGLWPPEPLSRGSAPGPRWGHTPRPPTPPTFAIPQSEGVLWIRACYGIRTRTSASAIQVIYKNFTMIRHGITLVRYTLQFVSYLILLNVKYISCVCSLIGNALSVQLCDISSYWPLLWSFCSNYECKYIMHNLYDHGTSTLQTDRQTDRRTSA